MMPLTLSGVIPPPITPFRKDESIDESTLRQLVHFWLDNGMAGLVTCGSNGEAVYMTSEEKKYVIKIVLDEVNGKVPVITGTGPPAQTKPYS